MNDKDQDKYNEEYHFVDEPDLGNFEEHPAPSTSTSTPNELPSASSKFSINTLFDSVSKSAQPVIELIKQNFMLRMGLIALGVIVLIAMIYRCTMNPLTKKTTEKIAPVTEQSIKPVVVKTSSVPTQVALDSQTIQMNAQNLSKMNDLEKAQQQLEAQVTSMSNNINTINGNITSVSVTVKQLSDQLAQLSLALENQAKVTAMLAEQGQRHAQKNVQMVRRSIPIQRVTYNLQAIIPGRAWLISSNGDTLTVREGTKLSPYGVIRYIDAKRGRVLTSSGQVIKFSQDDS